MRFRRVAFIRPLISLEELDPDQAIVADVEFVDCELVEEGERTDVVRLPDGDLLEISK